MYIHFTFIAITVEFNSATYIIEEDVGRVQLVLVLSNPSSFIETVQVIATEINATGKEK